MILYFLFALSFLDFLHFDTYGYCHLCFGGIFMVFGLYFLRFATYGFCHPCFGGIFMVFRLYSNKGGNIGQWEIVSRLESV